MKRLSVFIILGIMISITSSCSLEKDVSKLEKNYITNNEEIVKVKSDLEKCKEALKVSEQDLRECQQELEATLKQLNEIKVRYEELKESNEQDKQEKKDELDKEQQSNREFLFLKYRLQSLDNKMKTDDNISNYQWDLYKLDYRDIYSVTKAVNLYKQYVSSVASNDELYFVFFDYIYAMRDYYFSDYTYTYANENYIQDDYIENGFMFLSNEGFNELEVDPTFLHQTFENYVSEALNEYNKIVSIEQQQVGGTYYVMDMALCITWDELAERLIMREQYYNKYKDDQQYKDLAQDVKDYNDIFLRIYLGEAVLDNTPPYSYPDKKIKDEVLESYQKFMIEHPDSRYFQIIKVFYDILEQSEFRYNNEKLNEFYIEIFGERLW